MSDYPYGYCGMPCALCTRYRTDGKSRCLGCSAGGYYTDVCRVHHCCSGRSLVHCGVCEEYICARLGKMGDFRDLDTGNVKRRTCNDVSDTCFNSWYADYVLKAELLTVALEKYNNGRMKRYLCELFIKQDITTLTEIMNSADRLVCDGKGEDKSTQFKKIVDQVINEKSEV